jgi:hypothetical protein
MQRETFHLRDPRADMAAQRWQDLKSERADEERDWEDIARLIRPQRGGFKLHDFAGRPLERPLSSAPVTANNNMASGLYGTLTNPANRWMSMGTLDPDLADWQPFKEWADAVSNRILASFRPGTASFYPSAIQVFSDLTAFGNAPSYDELQSSEQRIMDVTLSLAEVVWDIDPFGQVVEVVRKFMWKPRQIMEAFTDVPPKVAELAEKGSNDKLVLYHHVHRNSDYRRGRIGAAGKRWRSLYVLEDHKAVLADRGYDEMPFTVARWEVESGRSVGTGPGFLALASARVNHQMEAANLRAGQYAADRALLAPDRDAWPLNGVVRPGSTIYGGVDYQGRQMIRPLDNVSGTGLSLDMQARKVEEIRDAFHWSLMNLAGRTGMTATEVMERQEEKLRLMAPHMGRVQEEYLAPKIARRFAMLWRAGQIPPPPEGLPEGTSLEVEYVSAAAMAQKSTEGAAVVRVLSDVMPLAQLDPRAMDRIDIDATLEVLAEARGVPSKILRSREEADAMAQARAQAQQAQAAMQAAQAGGGIMKDLAAAGMMGEPAE